MPNHILSTFRRLVHRTPLDASERAVLETELQASRAQKACAEPVAQTQDDDGGHETLA